MSVEVRPLGVSCNIQCQYCYQHPQRDQTLAQRHYDLEKILERLATLNQPFTVFGGEPLLIPIDDLERLFEFGYQRFGRCGVQTNGTLITDAHLVLFRRYNVHVGFSIDGPGTLNSPRWAGSNEKTDRATEASLAALEKLCLEGLAPSLIVTLTTANARGANIYILRDWLKHVASMGVKSMRLHLLESEFPEIREKYALNTDEYLRAFDVLGELAHVVQIDVYNDIERLLRGDDSTATCTWVSCDPMTTRAVAGVEGDGRASNCGRTNKDGIDYVKSGKEGFERYIALWHTPQEFGGCHGCSYFLMCRGQCPGTAIDGDWRNRTEHCEVWKAMFAAAESRMRTRGEAPITAADLTPLVTDAIAVWAAGMNISLKRLTERHLPVAGPEVEAGAK